MKNYPYGEEQAEEDSYEEPSEDDESILRHHAKLKIFRRILSILVILIFVGVFVAPELSRHLKSVFTGPLEPDYLLLIEDTQYFGGFNPGVVHYRIDYDAHLNHEMLESTFSQAAANWEGALDGYLDFERVEEGEPTDLLVLVVDNLSHPGRSYFEYKGNRYHPRVELNAPQLSDPKVLRMVVIHELGHVLGLWGHSDHSGDLMYPRPERWSPSDRDVNTLRLIYGFELR